MTQTRSWPPPSSKHKSTISDIGIAIPSTGRLSFLSFRFFFAIVAESLDIDLMDEVWATDASACCVQPGWERRARAYATNIFIFEDERWLLVVHHTSLVSGT